MAQDFTRWLVPGTQIYKDVSVSSHVNAGGYYSTLASLIEKTKSGDVIFLAGWEFDVFQPLGPNSSQGSTVSKLLEDAINRGAKVRVLLDFDQKLILAQIKGGAVPYRSGKNTEAAQQVEKIGGKALIDNQQRLFGSHHQKLAFLTVSGKAYAFCGGIDIARRWPWRDVQCEIRGGAAAEVFATLTERWESMSGSKTSGIQRSVRPISGSANQSAKNHVQFFRTYGKEDWWMRDRDTKRIYAKKGEFGVHSVLSRGIKLARRFIYVEDQYFFVSGMKSLADIGDQLRRQLSANPKLVLIVVIPRTEQINSEVRQGWYRRKQLIEKISNSISNAKNRIRIYQYKQDLAKGFSKNFVHSKVWIFDDEFAVIGSANLNRRGMSHDGELAVGIASRELFAKKLRMKMWLQHLNHSWKASGGFSEKDVREWPTGLVSLESSRSPLERYDPNGGADSFGKTPNQDSDEFWTRIIDPDGSA